MTTETEIEKNDQVANIVSPKMRSLKGVAEVENFYRYVLDNDIRHEARLAINHVLGFLIKANKKKKKAKKSVQ